MMLDDIGILTAGVTRRGSWTRNSKWGEKMMLLPDRQIDVGGAPRSIVSHKKVDVMSSSEGLSTNIELLP